MPKQKNNRIVAIVGFAPETRELCNREPENVELWGMNVGHTFMNRWDRWFQIHPLNWRENSKTEHPNCYGRDAAHVEFLATCGVPVYQQAKDERVPTSITYDIEKVWEDIWPGANRPPYLTSTPAYAIALAIYERVDEIKLFGLNLSASIEYVQQRACVEWLLGVATGRGIKVTVPTASPVLTGALYAHDNVATHQMIAQERLDGWREKHFNEWATWYVNVGAARENKTWTENLHICCDECKAKFEAVGQTRNAQFNRLLQKASGEIAYIGGGHREAMAWLARFDGIDVHAGNMPNIVLPEGIDAPVERWKVERKEEQSSDS